MGDAEHIYAFVANRIRHYRTTLGLSQAELGAALRPPLTRAAVCNMENARQRIVLHVLADVARVLDVPLHSFLPPSRK